MTGTQKLIVEVIDARNLLPKDGHGTSSPYVVVDFYGQRKKTQTVMRDLNPTWNEVHEFNVGTPSNVFDDVLELEVYHDKNYGPTRRNTHLGRIRLSSSQFVRKGEEALIYYVLENKYWLSWTRGEIGLKIYFQEELPTEPSPPLPPPAAVVEEDKVVEQPPPPEPETAKPGGGTEQEEKADRGDSPSEGVSSSATPPPPLLPTQAADNAAAEPEPIQQEKISDSDIGTRPPLESPQEEKKEEVTEVTTTLNEPMNLKSGSGAGGIGGSDIVFEPSLDNWAPPVSLPPQIVRTDGINGPVPLPRRPVVAPVALEHQESIAIERSSFDLVEKMHYLFVRVVKARYLPAIGSPVVRISVSGSRVQSSPARKTAFLEWDQTFAFGRDAHDSSCMLEVSVWDLPGVNLAKLSTTAANFLGGICFDVSEVPLRDPPDSPLAPQWYRLEGEGGARFRGGDLMLATWIGTQADEAFPEAWKTDAAGNINSRAKVYLSPKLWYLRLCLLEAQDLMTPLKESSFQIKAQLGFQVQKTKYAVTRNGSPIWNEDILFVASEPFGDSLEISLENRQPKGPMTVGKIEIPLTAIERLIDDRKVAPRWFSFEDPNNEKRKANYRGRVKLSLFFDGGYHLMDEPAHVCSDYRPTARQLWKPPVGTVELGIIGCKNLLPFKTVDGKGCSDAYCVAKYGPKWVRTRTVCDSLDPKWNEQYTWSVYDPCTMLTVGVFDSCGLGEIDGDKATTFRDLQIGKVRIRVSTLQTGRAYRNNYPLILLTNNGVKKMGEIEVAVRFVRASPTIDFLHVYSQPLLPLMHHIKPIGIVQQELLRNVAVKIIDSHLSRSEPPLRREIVLYMLDVDSHAFSMRKVRANWFRVINVIAGLINLVRWVDDRRFWKNTTATILVHALLVMLVWFPDLIVPTLAFYMFAIGAWNYRFRSKDPLPHFDPKLSLADTVDREELDEEFDTLPSSKSPDAVRERYDKLRVLGARVQTVLGDIATQGERVQALVTWRDPRATAIFAGLCFVAALVMYVVPSKMVAMAFGFYYFRHPIFRDRMPSPALNFFRRLPSLSDRIM